LNLNDSKFLCINHLRFVEPCGILDWWVWYSAIL